MYNYAITPTERKSGEEVPIMPQSSWIWKRGDDDSGESIPSLSAVFQTAVLTTCNIDCYLNDQVFTVVYMNCNQVDHSSALSIHK